jgi:hypothetical protein
MYIVEEDGSLVGFKTRPEVRVAASGSEMGNPHYSLNHCRRSFVVCTFIEIFFSECSLGVKSIIMDQWKGYLWK